MKIFNSLANTLLMLFFMGILCVILAVLVIFLITENNFKTNFDITKDDIASIEVNDFSIVQYSTNGAGLAIFGARAQNFKDEQIFYDVILRRVDGGVIQNLSGEKIVRKNNLFNFENGINFSQKNGVNFRSERGLLDLNRNIFLGSGEFFLQQNFSDFVGKNLFYDLKNRKISGEKVRAALAPDPKKSEKNAKIL